MKHRSYQYIQERPNAFPVPVVGLWKRFTAYLIDNTLLGIIGVVLFGLGALISADRVSFNNFEQFLAELDSTTLVINGASVVIAIIYYVGCWAGGGQTLGKLVMGIKIVGEDGRAPSFAAAIIRYIGYFISNLAFSFGFAAIAFDKRRQGWHDKWANTFVVAADIEVPPGAEPVFLLEDPLSQQDQYAVYLYYGLSCILPFCIVALMFTLLPQVMGNIRTSP